jgi:UDP-N-acetylglucosamine 4-epimerase
MGDYNSMYNDNLYKKKYHDNDISSSSFLITGGAGFIGSNIVEYLLKNNAGKVRVLDNLSNGYFDNIKNFISLSNFEFIEGDIRNLELCKTAIEGMDFVSHQAALGSVPRSIADPITTNDVNISGFLNILNAAKESKKLKRFIYAASSSTYGDSSELPKIEGREGKILSPYAVTKAVNEMYADVFSKVNNFHSIGLRYFNVFGPKQNPNNPYAAVIPLFCKNFILNQRSTIFGDGLTSRDFTFVENVVQANIKALLFGELNNHEVFNVACGDQTSLNEIINYLNKLNNKNLNPIYEDSRKGDIRHSRASIDKICNVLNYNPEFNFEQGLKIVFDWYQNQYL